MYGIILTGSSFVCGIVLLCMVYAKRPPGILWPSLFFVYLGATIWSAGELMTAFIVDNPTDYWTWVVILYLGIYLLLGSWLTFGLRYAALLEVELPKQFSVLAPAAIVFYGLMSLMTITNPWHGQFMAANMNAPNDFGLLWYLQASVGYLILLYVGGLFVYLRFKKHNATVSRQATILLLATCIPMIANILYISQIAKPGFDITIPAFSLSSILFFLGIYRDRLFILSPIPLQQVIQNEQDGIFILDNHGQILLFNHAAHELLHKHDIFTNDQLTPILSQYLYRPDNTDQFSQDDLAELLDKKEHPVNGYLLRMDHPDTKWIRLACTTLPSPRNRPAGKGVRLRDVTVLQQATEAMTNQTMILEGILRSSDQGILVVDNNGDILFVNSQFKELWSLPHSLDINHLTKKLIDTLLSQLKEPVTVYEKSVNLNENPLHEGHDDLHFSDGRILHRTTRPLVRDGKVAGRIWAYIDVTELLHANEALSQSEQQLAESNQMLRSVLDTIPVRVFWKDLALNYLGGNRVFAQDQQVNSTEEIIGKNDNDMLWHKSAKKYRSQDRAIIASGKPQLNYEQNITQLDGHTIWLRSSKVPLRNSDDEIIGILGTYDDISAQKMAEIALANSQKETEAINEQLKKALHETEKLARKADRANAAKTDFLANMSHEIRTSMNGIIGMTQLLLDSPMNVEQRLFADTAHNGAKTLLSIINDILDYSKISAGKMIIETVDLDLRQLLEETIDLLTVAAEEAGLDLYCCIDAAVPQIISSDPTRLRQIILNLVNNAIKFTPHGEVEVYCSLDKLAPHQPSIRIEVRDTGIGISLEQQIQLFEPFTQADSSTTRNFGGSGLGLSICKTLVNLMNGSIGLESRENQGSTFWISLPVNTQYTPPVSLNIFQGQTCLITSSKPHFINILSQYLTSWGAVCRTASTSQDAEKQLTIHPLPAVILVDFTLEDMSGIEFGKQLQAHPDFGTIPRLLYFPLYKSDISSSLVSEYFTQSLTLPIKILPLQEALSKCINAPEQVTTSTSSPSPIDDTEHPDTHVMRVLLVEDNSVNQLIAGRLLKNLNVDYDQVVNGQDALQAIKENRYDLVFMDCQMPIMDGYKTAQAIRNLSDPDRQSLPIIAMTASAIKGDRERCFEAGMDGYLTKPIHLEQLKDIVEKYTTSPSQVASDVSDRPAPQPG